MSDATIRCPKCKTEIPLTEAMAGPLLQQERDRHAAEIRKLGADVDAQRAQLEKDRENLSSEIAAAAKRQAAAEIERQRKEIKDVAATEIEQANEAAKRAMRETVELGVKLEAAQKAQAAAIRKERELDDARRELDLTVEKRVSEASAAVRAQAQRDAEAALALKVTERDEMIAGLNRQVEELRLAAEQGSTRIQGEAQEIDLEQSLRAKFPIDAIDPVGKFVDGADVLHHVTATDGSRVGTIVWESKRTKNWNANWLAKLRQDQRAAKAEVAVIVSRALPDDVETFALVDEVWVCAPRHAMTLGFLLRRALVDVNFARQVSAGQATKAELLYRYLTGPQFKQRVEAVAEKLAELRDDLDRERKALSKQWAKREQNLEVMATALAGMYGDVQGLAGKAVGELAGPSQLRLEE